MISFLKKAKAKVGGIEIFLITLCVISLLYKYDRTILGYDPPDEPEKSKTYLVTPGVNGSSDFRAN